MTGLGARRRVLLLIAVLSAASALAAGVATPAGAGGNGAEVVRFNERCLVRSKSGDTWWASCTIRIVFGPAGITQSIVGTVISEESDPLPSTVVTDFAGQPCLQFEDEEHGGYVVLTRATAGVLTPTGQVQLTCKS